MSEYQYYEFLAIDKPLNSQQMAELREISTRAEITKNSFVNVYHWGDFKGNPRQLVEQYFDAFVYVANWCSCQFIFRVPLNCLSAGIAKTFTSEMSDAFEITQTSTGWIIDFQLFESENYHRFGEEDGTEWMSRLTPLRDELLRGDLRSLYLGWLSCINNFDDDMSEISVPAGLGELTAAQEALVEFLEIDVDFINAAAITSPPLVSSSNNTDHQTWLDLMTAKESTHFLKLLLEGRSQEAERELKTAFFKWQREQDKASATPQSKLRTIGELTALAQIEEKSRLQREAIAAKRKAEEKQRKRQENLRIMFADAELHWASADAKAQRVGGSSYDEATRIISELAEAHKLAGKIDDFKNALTEFLEVHGKRKALIERLKKSKLL